MSWQITISTKPVIFSNKITLRPSWALDFYNQHPVQITELADLQKDAVWIYGTDDDLKKLKESGLDWDKHFTADQFRITRLQPKFLNPTTREMVLNKMHLIHLYK